MSGVEEFRSVARRAPRRRIPNEIAFLEAYGVSRDVLLAAVDSAERCGAPVDVALLAEGAVSDEQFYRALAHRLGAPYLAEEAAFSDTRSPGLAIASGLVGLAGTEEARAAIAPQGAALTYLLEARARGAALPPIVIATRRRLSALVRAQFGASIAREAAERLGDWDPSLTARSGFGPARGAAVIAAMMIGVAIWMLGPGPPRLAISAALWLVFAAAILLRSAAAAAADSTPAAPPLIDEDLPVYTVIVAMYREGRVVGQLVRALDALDYPRAKLDIKLVIERGDRETADAIAALRLPTRYDVIVAPKGLPRTKPRALNVALAAARGELIVVFDAEDEPAPDQLRLAAARFAAEPGLDAMQARLTIGNAGDHWLSELYAIEYATLFDLVNPGLAALDLPIALGGTSNHFRIRELRRVGGWDAWNVTEDIDLGIRLARFGARVGSLASDTREEAPNEFGNWFWQRVRWQKGWMQTLIVHARHPVRLFRELGLRNGLAAIALVGGAVFGGLFGPPLLLEALWRGACEYSGVTGAATRGGDVVTYILTLAGAQSVAIPALVAMRRRGMTGAARAMLLLPVYFTLVTLATWVGLFDLALRPFHWSKTEHGRAGIAPRSTVARLLAPPRAALARPPRQPVERLDHS